MVTLDDIRDLQRKLASVKNLAEFWDAFFALVERPDGSLMAISHPKKEPKLTEMLLSTLARVWPKKTDVLLAEARLMWIPEARMAHGQLTINKSDLVAVVYFEDTKMAAMSFMMPDGQTGMVRLTVTDMNPARRM